MAALIAAAQAGNALTRISPRVGLPALGPFVEVIGEARQELGRRLQADPSDRYVQSLPGSSEYRIAADASGFDNLALAGDWTDSGLNAGCIEAAAISGLQAANTVLGKEIGAGVLGGWVPLRGSGRRAT
jgi:hypothetical protein